MQPTGYYDKWFWRRIHARPTISKRILFNEVLLRIKKNLSKSSGDKCRILDVGCGAGHLISLLLGLKNVEITGIDITDKVIDTLKVLYPTAKFRKTNYSEPQDAEENFDIVTAVEIIEHIPYAKQSTFIENIQHSLKPGGILILTTPNKGRAHRIPNSFRNTQPIEDWLTIEQIKDLLNPGFDQIVIGTCIWYFPTRIIDMLFKRLFYPFHIKFEQDLLRRTKLGGHIVVTATRR